MMIRPLLVIGFLLVAGAGSAAEPADYSGRFEPVDLAAATADKEKAVDLTVSAMPRLVRGFARSRLSQAATVTQFFEFVGSSNRMITSSDRAEAWTTDLSATEATFTSDQGDVVTLTRWMSGGVLLTNAEVKKGSRSSRFELSKDGQELSVTTAIKNKHLSRPLVYQTQYRRVR